MARRKVSRGTGITKRELECYEFGPEDDLLSREADALFEQLERQSDLDSVLSDIEAEAASILEAATSQGVADDTPGDCARRALKLIRSIRHWLTHGADEEGAAETACRKCLALGSLLKESQMKGRWEVPALTGEKMLSDFDGGRAQANQARHVGRIHEWERWQEAANEYWSKPRHASASRNAVAIFVKAKLRLDEAPKTIARRLKKVGQAS